MKRTVRWHWVAAALPAVMLVSCAMIPAKLVRSTAPGMGGCGLSGESLHGLLALSLETPNRGESAHALGHFVERWRAEKGEELSGFLSPGLDEAEGTAYRVRFRTGRAGSYAPGYFDEITPAIDYSVKRLEHHRKEGVGAPLRTLRHNTGSEPVENYYPPEGISREVTAVAHVGALRRGEQSVEIELLDSLYHESVVIAGRPEALAADYTVSLAGLLEGAKDLSRSEFADLFSAQPRRQPQLYLMEPYDPRKEPLVMIHGLLDSPLTWAKLTNRLRSEEDLRGRYQVWHYLYNTSAPALYSGRILRGQYRELRSLLDPSLDDPALRGTTLLTHSMGGIVARALITEPGNAFWEAGFTRPLESLRLSPEDRAALVEAFLWDPEPSVRRVIFIAVPHRGSEFADNPIGQLGKTLVSPPAPFREFYERISAANPGAFTEAYAELGEGRLDSVGSLSPRQPTLQILSDLPLGHPVELHSIIANRDRNGPIEKSTDGIVAYWSSHIDNVESETIVPYRHACLGKDKTIEEVIRILRLR